MKVLCLIATVLWCLLKLCRSDVYLSPNGTDMGDCSHVNTSCETWDYAITEFGDGNNETFYIENGMYNITTYFTTSSAGRWNIIGESAQDVIIVAETSGGNFFYSSNSLARILLSNFTYFPYYGLDTRMGYFAYGYSMTLSNIIIDGRRSDSSSSYDMMYYYFVDYVTIDNFTMYDMITDTGDRVFEILYSDYVNIKNVLVEPRQTSFTHEELRFLYVGYTYDDVTIQDVLINKIKTTYTIWIYYPYAIPVLLKDIAFQNVYGGPFFAFSYGQSSSVTLQNSTIKGVLNNNRKLEGSMIYLQYNGGTFNLNIENCLFSTFIFDQSGIGIHLDIASSDTNYVYLTNVVFENLQSQSVYGLIYIEDNFIVNIDGCTFANNTNFVAMIHCASGSLCDVTVSNSLFVNNEGQCFNGDPVRNGIFLNDDAEGTVVFKNTTFYGDPWRSYDSTSTVTFDSHTTIYNTTNAWYNDEQCRKYGLELYYAHNETQVAGNNCTTLSTTPCSTWDEIDGAMQNGDIVYLVDYHHDVTSQFNMREVRNIWEDQNYTFIGVSPENTSIFLDTSTNYLFYIYVTGEVVDSIYPPTHLAASNFLYRPDDGLDQYFVYGYYAKSVIVDNLILDFVNGDSSAYYDVFYCYYCDYVKVTNVDIWAALTYQTSRHVFEMGYSDYVYFDNINVVPKSLGDDDSDIELAYIYNVQYGEFTWQNMYIKNYYSSDMTYFSSFSYSNVYFNNITVENVYGGSFWQFVSGNTMNLTMDHIYMNGYGRALEARFVYYSSNYYSTAIFSNSIYENYVLEQAAVGFYFDSEPYWSTIYFENVIFRDLFSESAYGLIYIEDAFEVVIKNCTFTNNTDFVSLVHCAPDSYCNVTITDSTFDNNTGQCHEYTDVNNGILLYDDSHARLTIENSLFIGGMWIYSDSTSSVSIDTNTQSMLIEDSINQCRGHETMEISAFNNRHVIDQSECLVIVFLFFLPLFLFLCCDQSLCMTS